ncbi:DNA-binding domain-containing protein, AraC-type [Frankia canadensis]|uniref:DNA-binding domain-containing protein, AraC-type n=1 Tax=Frankia canadensis TaxID=1836972 RepID=A0A2I2KQ10_9ACTN|nr:AraC family transcriptional regulator [Frankia canadensis]SNQ47740.1 DNA-binding domain-containing protein, AraC-type [Frankia canadensis]SOU55030.1 DNA-binding domain-containing protein, AraC-type [Frankia canadensis]
MTRRAFSFVRSFPPEPARELCVDRHYLLCASAGVLRLEAQGQVWLLPPARAALIEAHRPIRVSIPRPVTTASVLFDPDFAPRPPAPLTVFDLSPLARALVAECRAWDEDGEALPTYAATLFAALAAVCWRLAERPSPCVVPAGRSPELRRALHITEQRLATDIRFEDVAREVGLVPRSLARRFEAETGLTWRAVLRRLRVLHAIEELTDSELSVTNIAFASGYTSLSAFNTAFRDLTGRTPTEFRASFCP